MADARAHKLKEYGTDLISHPETVKNDYKQPRRNDTFNSNVMHLEPNHKFSQEVQNRRQFNLQDKVLKKGAPRASY